MEDVLNKASQVRLVIFDVDGVLTDGSLYLDEAGQEYKVFHSRDGHGMKMLKDTGVELAVITARQSQAVAHRMAGLGIGYCYQGQQDKLSAFEGLLRELGISPEQSAYVGDDVVDLPVMVRAGLAIAVADAHPLVSRHAHWQTPSPGGRGAAREVCELVMEAQGTLIPALAVYLPAGVGD